MKQLLVLLFFLCSTCAFAQDVIVKKDGSTILSRVLEVNQNEVKYKKFNNLDGPTYSISKSELQSINYKNGAKDTFSAPIREENRYLPNNQNDGSQRMNDKALLAIDYSSNHKDPYKKAKTLRTIGWIGAIPFVGMAVYCFQNSHSGTTGAGIGFLAAGAVWTSSFLLVGNHIERKADSMIQYSSIYQKNFKFKNGSAFTPGLDILRDQATNQQTLGLGIRYNF